MTHRIDPYDVVPAIEAARPAIERICADVWELAELSLHEGKSAKVHLRELSAAGFTITSTGTTGVPTAFVAEWSQGNGGPTFGFLPEYDALPGLGNAAVPRQQPRADGVTTGHGCGHNLLGAGLTGAAIATKQIMEAQDIPGTLRVYGCAAEETEGAKVYMARAGLFDDLAACLHWHPASFAGVLNVRMASAAMFKLDFHGTSAHAGLEPWQVRSAVDALELAAHALNQMREHLEPTARTHYIFEAAGVAPNIVPDYARMWLMVRDVDRAHVVATTAWVQQIAAGAALATQTRAEVIAYLGMHDLLPNTPLAKRMQAHLEQVGVPDWSAEEQAFARACQQELSLPEQGLAPMVLPLPPEPTVGASSDVAEASWIAPTMGITMVTMPVGVTPHTWPVTACGGTSIGVRGTLAAAQVLALTALDMLTDTELREAARADLERRTAGYRYVSPLAPEQQHPIDLPAWMVADGATEALHELEHRAT